MGSVCYYCNKERKDGCNIRQPEGVITEVESVHSKIIGVWLNVPLVQSWCCFVFDNYDTA